MNVWVYTTRKNRSKRLIVTGTC